METNTVKFTCDICDYKTNNISNWTKHINSNKHTTLCKTKKTYLCVQCCKIFKCKTPYEYHIKNVCKKKIDIHTKTKTVIVEKKNTVNRSDKSCDLDNLDGDDVEKLKSQVRTLKKN